MNKKSPIDTVSELQRQVSNLNRKLEINSALSKVLQGKLLAKLNNSSQLSLHEAEFRVFSQFGDDGIIQYLINLLNIQQKTFIEFGVANYNESNTRFLLESNNWRGLVIDGSTANVEYIKKTENYWRHNLTAINSFVTTENINKIFKAAGFTGEIGLLHIDIDGNDYWLWQAIEVINPLIVIVEYNSFFGRERTITIPYDAGFQRYNAHASGLYAGASLPALCQLASKKGYGFIGCNSAGNNAYFVRDDHLGSLTALSASDGYVPATFREHRDADGMLTFCPPQEALNSILGMPVYNTQTNLVEPL
ncbi:hypothetical protein [Salinimonas sediminis]|uniref:Uncharacterized protein n=1 Tax=Salinimonas sediminis TaxID=2303538 RepID=A0A346NJL9_9ALTE|nr:hypothetical protein [Salinimonas sediminis]AXR05726.1 hypothetical protein D0Y50_04650 [Salinimonas sediminis]